MKSTSLKEIEEVPKMVSKPSLQSPAAGKEATLMDLPTELHLQIASYLIYPDALSLKYTNRHFKSFVYTGVNLKVEWLLERRGLHLDCPNDKGCELGSDTKFCRGSMSLLMRRRREHCDCDDREGGRGCLIFGTRVCTNKKKPLSMMPKMRKWIGTVARKNGEFWWIVVAAVGLLTALGWAWIVKMEATGY